MAAHPGGTFSGGAQIHDFAGFLFDLDGTIIDSTPAVVKHWQELGAELGIDPNVILATSHGRRSIDVLQLYDPSKANWEYVSHIEGLIPKKHGSDAKELPGARIALDSLTEKQAPWAIVTSGTTALMTGWFSVLSLPLPAIHVVAEDVQVGKPDPSCYLLGKKRIGLAGAGSCKDILVVEDAPAGVKAGKAAGCMVLALATTHSVESVLEAGADWVVQNLASLKILEKHTDKTRTKVEIRDTWQAQG